MMKNKDKPLSAKIEKDQLVIRIGIDTLAYAAERCPLLYNYDKNPLGEEPYIKVEDKIELAKDTIYQLFKEREDGSSPISDLLDDATLAAYEDGSLAFEDKDIL